MTARSGLRARITPCPSRAPVHGDEVDQISAPRVARLELLHGAEQAEHEKGRPVVNREWMACQPSLRAPVCAAPGAGSGGRRGRFQTPSSPNVFLENFSASSAPSAFQIVSASSFRTRSRHRARGAEVATNDIATAIPHSSRRREQHRDVRQPGSVKDRTEGRLSATGRSSRRYQTHQAGLPYRLDQLRRCCSAVLSSGRPETIVRCRHGNTVRPCIVPRSPASS